MNKGIDCQVFEDQLEGFSRGTLSEEGMDQLRLHARSCLDCAMQLKVHRHLAVPSLEDLEGEVPDAWVDSMWPQVQAEIARQGSRGDRVLRMRRVSGWFIPATAAAAVLLLLSVALLYQEMQQLRARERTLVQQVADQERWLAELDLRTTPNALARTAGLGASRSWQRMLARTDNVTISELTAALSGVQAGTMVLDAVEAERLIRRVPFLRATAWSSALEEIAVEDGLQADEALRLLEALALAPERSVRTSRLLEFTAASIRVGRS